MSSSSSSTALVVCIDCAEEIAVGADQCNFGCGHQLHLSCYLRLYTNHSIAQCFKCSTTVPITVDNRHNTLLSVDMGRDANVRRLVQERCLMPASALVRATFTDHQPLLKPAESNHSLPRALKDNPLLAPLLERAMGPEVSYTAQNSAKHVLHALHQGYNAQQFRDAGITIDHLVAAGVHWQLWHDLGYGVRTAVDLGARWRNLLDMGFGNALAKYGENDYHLLHEPPLQVSFAQLLQDVFHNDYAALAERRLDAPILAALGMHWDTLLRLKFAQHEDLAHFGYLPLQQIATYLGMTKATMMRERFSLDFLGRMKWTLEQLTNHLKLSMEDLRSIYGNAFTLVPTRKHYPLM